MAYCRKCGKEVKGEACSCGKEAIKTSRKMKLDVKGIIKKPIDYIDKIDSKNHFITSVVIMVAACVSFGLMFLGLIKNIIYVIFGLIKTFVFMLADKAVVDVALGQEFMKIFEGEYEKEVLGTQIAEINKSINSVNVILYAAIALAVILAIYALIIYLVAVKKDNKKIPIKDCFTFVGYPALVLIIANLLAYFSLFIWLPLFFICLLVGIIIYVSLLSETIERRLSVESDFSPYLVAGGFIASLIVTTLLALIILG